jgi:poly-gamma-glutamate capsule biosynthesis protein CapA/YwtB (metallophosphatase superfamily)
MRFCIIALLAAGLALLPAQAQSNEEESKQDFTGLLLVQTGWTSDLNDISPARLKSEYCAGRVERTKQASLIAKEIFGCEVAAEFTGPTDFYPKSKNRLIIVDLAEAIPRLKTLTVDSVSPFRDQSGYTLKSRDQLKPVPITHMIMTGTTAISRYTGQSADQHGIGVLTEKIRPYFQTAQYVHVSNEASFTKKCVFQAGLRFCSKEAHFQAFKDIRVNVVELTGNHNLDFGAEPFLTTLDWFHQNGMRTFGGGSDEADASAAIFLNLNGGGAIGILGFNELCPYGECATDKKPGASRFQIEKARKLIEEMKKARPDAFLIATVQFGEIDSYHPTPSQRSISFALIDAGADLVFGSQAHHAQQMEFHKGKIILHGLGNFLFDQIHMMGLREGYFMNLYFARNRLIAMEPVFTCLDEKFRPALATEKQALQIRKAIYSDQLLYK